MTAELNALLAVQRDDEEIRALERERRALEPRLAELGRRRQIAVEALERARRAAEEEEKRLHEREHRVSEHRALHERNVRQLDQVRRTREATAATSQVEQARRILADEEVELQSGARRLTDLRQGVTLQEQAVADLDAEQATARREVEAEIARLEAALAEARGKRRARAQSVPAPLLARYDKIATRRQDDALYPLRGASCASCDTALPLQRRSMMMRTGAIEVCEACGVLLYAAE